MTTPATALAATSSYYDSLPGVRLLRLSLGAVQTLWPTLGVRAAHQLFTTPLPPRWLQPRTRWGADWQSESWPFEQASVTVHHPRGGPAGPVVVLAHGWGGHAGQMQALAEHLFSLGLRPMVVDLPAHGASRGRRSALPQFMRALDYVVAQLRAQGHRVQALVAHSLGANAAAAAVSRGLTVDQLVLLAPPASPRQYTRLFAQVFGLNEATRQGFQQRIEAQQGMLMRNLEPQVVGPRIHAATLVVHDRSDRINAFADGQAYTQAIAGAQLLATDGLGHRRILHDPAVVQAVGAFVTGQAAGR